MWAGIGKVLWKGVLLLMPFIIIVMIIMRAAPMYVFDGEYAMYLQQKDYIYENSDYNRVVIIGDSRTKAGFDPKLLSEDTYNLALGGTTAVENYYYLKEYLERKKKPEYLFLSISPDRMLNIDCLWTRSVYFHRIENKDLLDLFQKTQLYKGTEEINIHHKYFELLQYQLFFVTKYGKTCLNGMIEGRLKKNQEIYNTVKENRGQMQFGTKDYCDLTAKEADMEDFVPNDILDVYYREIINICEKNGIQVIIESLPINEATYSVCSKKVIKNYMGYLKMIQKQYPDAVVNTDFTYYGNEYFGDASHLNRKGTDKFSKYIKSKYRNIFD